MIKECVERMKTVLKRMEEYEAVQREAIANLGPNPDPTRLRRATLAIGIVVEEQEEMANTFCIKFLKQFEQVDRPENRDAKALPLEKPKVDSKPKPPEPPAKVGEKPRLPIPKVPLRPSGKKK